MVRPGVRYGTPQLRFRFIGSIDGVPELPVEYVHRMGRASRSQAKAGIGNAAKGTMVKLDRHVLGPAVHEIKYAGATTFRIHKAVFTVIQLLLNH